MHNSKPGGGGGGSLGGAGLPSWLSHSSVTNGSSLGTIKSSLYPPSPPAVLPSSRTRPAEGGGGAEGEKLSSGLSSGSSDCSGAGSNVTSSGGLEGKSSSRGSSLVSSPPLSQQVSHTNRSKASAKQVKDASFSGRPGDLLGKGGGGPGVGGGRNQIRFSMKTGLSHTGGGGGRSSSSSTVSTTSKGSAASSLSKSRGGAGGGGAKVSRRLCQCSSSSRRIAWTRRAEQEGERVGRRGCWVKTVE